MKRPGRWLGRGDARLAARRHLLFLRQRGGYVVRLFANTNGATHNGAELTAGVERTLAVGDRIAIGAFTVIRATAIRS